MLQFDGENIDILDELKIKKFGDISITCDIGYNIAIFKADDLLNALGFKDKKNTLKKISAYLETFSIPEQFLTCQYKNESFVIGDSEIKKYPKSVITHFKVCDFVNEEGAQWLAELAPVKSGDSAAVIEWLLTMAYSDEIWAAVESGNN